VTIQWQPGGHELTPNDVHEAKRWLDSLAVAAVSS
jgi:predicted esterase